MVVLVDEGRENEGDLVMAAEFVTPAAINFRAKQGRGLICLTLTEERCRQLNLPLMVNNNRSQLGTNFTVSIEAARGVTTGISAADRARTVQAAVKREAVPEDIVQPGHIFPLMAQKGGVLVRAGHTEAGCDLAQLGGLTPAAVICEVLRDDGEMARLPDLLELPMHGLGGHHRRLDPLPQPADRSSPAWPNGRWTRLTADGLFALRRCTATGTPALVRASDSKDIGASARAAVGTDLLDAGSLTHSWNLNEALRTIAAADCGVLVLLIAAKTAGAVGARAGDADWFRRGRTPRWICAPTASARRS
jgi:3,4-dihydroxy 2-butanone 4-phosphate synthase/GTP cyclohydrolase II